VKKGFKGKIICTSGTYDIAKIVIMDSARIQEEDYEYWKKKSPRSRTALRGPLYTVFDALETLGHFNRLVGYEAPVRLNDRVKVIFRDAGHIFGAAFIEVDVKGFGRIVFSGDLGNRDKPIIKDPVDPRKADVVVIEGTYANREHKDIDTSVQELREAILDSFRAGGNVLIPTFAIERAQELLYFLREFYDKKQIPSCKVFLDSPMGISVTNIMRKYPQYFDKETAALLRKNIDPLRFPWLTFTKTQEASRQINLIKRRAVILAGSGMCTGGRIKHHLKFNIWRKESSIIFIGYQARGTLGRLIVDGKDQVKIYGRGYNVNSKVYTIGGFSAHADRHILTGWLKKTGLPRHVFLVHGEKDTLSLFKKELRDRNIAGEVHIPAMHSRHTL
jgi:metallo-beta-lactamase family protein